MSKVSQCVLCVLFVFVSYVSCQVNPLSPCPKVFQYVNDGQTWHGIITVGPPYDSDLLLEVKMDVPGTLPSRYSGRIDMLGERSEVAVSLTNGRNLRYQLNFPTLDHIPVITSIRLNGNQLCSGEGLRGISFTSVDLKHTLNTNLNNVYRGPSGVPTQPSYSEFPDNFGSSGYYGSSVSSPQQGFPAGGTSFFNNPIGFGSTNQMQPINPSNPWLTNAFNMENEIRRQFMQNNPNMFASNPWLQNVFNQTSSPTQPSRPSVQNQPRPPVQTQQRPPVQNQPRPPVQTQQRPPVQNQPIPQVQNQPRPPVQTQPRPTVQNQPRPTTTPQPTFDRLPERPNPDTFALSNRRTTTPSPVVSPENDRTETRNICGISKKLNNALVVRGEQTEKGDWPWLAAIFLKKVSSLNYRCGGALISKELVVSAAHCLGQNSNRQVRKEEVLIRLGVFNMGDWVDPDAKSHPVIEIILPPSFEGGLVLRNDIVLLKMNRIKYTDYVIPACLWSESLDVNPFYGQNGTLIGWGRDENGLIASQEPRLTSQRIVTTDECRESNPAFNTLTSSTTLCAGNRDGTGPCNGDSGGGMYLNVNGRWTLRGIMSTSLALPDAPNTCNLADFLVYTDVAKFISWINYYL